MVTRRQTLATALAASAVQPLSAALIPNRRAAFLEHVRKTMATTGVPGMSLALVEDGRITHLDGFGTRSIEDPARVDADTLFRAGSVSKPITALTLVRLAKEGKLNLDKPVATYLRQFRTKFPVSVRQLLNQTSALNDGTGEQLGPNPQTLDYIKEPLAQGWEPGRFFSYSNPGFALAGAVVDALGGASFAAEAARIMAAAGMARATFDVGTALTHPHTAGHDLAGGKLAVTRPEKLDVYDADRAAGALFASARELGRFAEWMVAASRPGSPDAEVWREMTTAGGRLDAVGLDYGLGLALDGSRGALSVGHGGSISGYRAAVNVLPEHGLGIALLANRSGRALTDGLVNDAFERLAGVAPLPPAPAARVADQLGRYQITRLDGTTRIVEVLAAGKTIAVRRADGFTNAAERSIRPDVYASADGLRVFVRDGNRRVVGMNNAFRHWVKL